MRHVNYIGIGIFLHDSNVTAVFTKDIRIKILKKEKKYLHPSLIYKMWIFVYLEDSV